MRGSSWDAAIAGVTPINYRIEDYKLDVVASEDGDVVVHVFRIDRAPNEAEITHGRGKTLRAAVRHADAVMLVGINGGGWKLEPRERDVISAFLNRML